MTIEDITKQPDFEKARDTYIEGVLNQGTGRDFLSILTQNGYELTQDPSQVNENTILVKADSNGMLQPDKESLEKHRGRAKEIMQEAISVQLDMIQSPGGTVSDSLTISNQKRGDELKGGGDVYALVADLQSQDANTVSSAATQLENIFSGITRIQHLRDDAGRNIGMQIYTDTSKQPVPVQFRDPEGNIKSRSQITAELFPIFNDGELTTQQQSDIKSEYLSGLSEEQRSTFNSMYTTPFISETETYGVDLSRPTVIDQTNIINKENKDNAVTHTKALKDILDNDELTKLEKKKEIKDLNKQYQQQLGNSLSFTNRDGVTESLRLEQDDESNLIIKEGGKTYTIVNTVTGDVDLAALQKIIDSKQAPKGSLTTRNEGRWSKHNNND